MSCVLRLIDTCFRIKNRFPLIICGQLHLFANRSTLCFLSRGHWPHPCSDIIVRVIRTEHHESRWICFCDFSCKHGAWHGKLSPLTNTTLHEHTDDMSGSRDEVLNHHSSAVWPPYSKGQVFLAFSRHELTNYFLTLQTDGTNTLYDQLVSTHECCWLCRWTQLCAL